MRALETFGTDPHIGADAFRKYKFDIRYSAHSEVAKIIAEVCTHPETDLVSACTLLKSWNRSTDIHNRGAAAILMSEPVSRARHDHNWSLTPVIALHRAIDQLQTHFHRIDPEWGQVNRFRRGTFDAPIDGGPDTYRAVYGEPRADDGTLTAVDGDTLIMFVTWDKNGRLSSQSIPPVRLCDTGYALRALCRSIAAVRRDEDKACHVHCGGTQRPTSKPITGLVSNTNEKSRR